MFMFFLFKIMCMLLLLVLWNQQGNQSLFWIQNLLKEAFITYNN